MSDMENSKNLTIGQKIKIARKKRGMSQEDLGRIVPMSSTAISEIESGKRENPSTDIVWAIQVALKLENVPFTEQERKEYEKKLFEFRDLIVVRELDEAKIMQKGLSDILLMPFNPDLRDWYNLIYCKLLLKLSKNKEAEKIMEALDIEKYKDDNRFMYNYFYNKGALSYSNAEYKQAYDFFDTARKYMQDGFEQNAELHYALASCEAALGHFNRANKFLVRGRKLYSGDKITVPELAVDSLIAVLYIRTGDFEEAKKMLDKYYKKAVFVRDKYYIGAALLDYGYLYEQAGYYARAIEYLDQAFEYFEKGSRNYKEMMYRKGRCLIGLGRYVPCNLLIADGKKLSEGDKKYTILFKSLECLASLTNPDSVKYLENIAIPSLLEIGNKTATLDYCEVLLKHFENQGARYMKRTLYLSEIVRNIYKDILRGGELEWGKNL